MLPAGYGIREKDGLQVSHSGRVSSAVGQYRCSCGCCHHPGHMGFQRVHHRGEQTHTGIPLLFTHTLLVKNVLLPNLNSYPDSILTSILILTPKYRLILLWEEALMQ